MAIDQSHQSPNEPVPYPTIHHSEQKCAHFYSKIPYCGIWETAWSWVITSFLDGMNQQPSLYTTDPIGLTEIWRSHTNSCIKGLGLVGNENPKMSPHKHVYIYMFYTICLFSQAPRKHTTSRTNTGKYKLIIGWIMAIYHFKIHTLAYYRVMYNFLFALCSLIQ